MYTALLFDPIAAAIPFPQPWCSQAAKSLGPMQAPRPHSSTAGTQKMKRLQCVHIDFASQRCSNSTEPTTPIKMIWLALQLCLLLPDPFFLLNGIIDLEFIAT